MSEFEYHLKDHPLGLQLQIIVENKPFSEKGVRKRQKSNPNPTLAILSTLFDKFAYDDSDKFWVIPRSKIKTFLDKCALIRPLYFEGISFILDRINPWALSIEVLVDGEEAVMSAIAQSAGLTVDINDGLFIYATPCYLIAKGYCRELPLDCDQYLIQALTRNQCSEQTLDLLKELENEEGFSIDLNGTTSQDIEALFHIKPQPQLIFTDLKSGAAEVVFDYKGHLIPCFDQREKIIHPKQTIKRDVKAEKELLNKLQEVGFNLYAGEYADYICSSKKIFMAIKTLRKCGWVILMQDKPINLLERDQTQVEVNLEALEIELKTERVRAKVPLIEGLTSSYIHQGDTYFLLSDDLKESISKVQILAKEGKEVTVLDKIINPEISQVSFSNDDQDLTAFINRDWSLEEIPDYSGLGFKLREYQRKGAYWLSKLHKYKLGGLLCDDMGLGKTVQVIAFLSRLKLAIPALIVVPKSLLFNWQKQFEVIAPSMRVSVLWGQSLSFDKLSHEGVWLTTYSTFLNHKDHFQTYEYTSIIIDESQLIKSSKTQAFKFLAKLQASSRFCLSATPMENSPAEMMNLLRFVLPFNHLDKLTSTPAITKHFILRRTKQEVAKDLPSKQVSYRYIEPYPDEKEFYSRYLSQMPKDKHVFEQLIRLRQIACFPKLVEGSTELNVPKDCAKMDYAFNRIKEALSEGLSLILFSQFIEVINALKTKLETNNLEPLLLTGQTDDRQSIVGKFQNTKEAQVLLSSLKAGGSGLNLTRADIVIIYDPWWNDAVEEQAIDRAHRIGRKDPVLAEKLVSLSTVEERMLEVKASKLHQINAAYKSLDQIDMNTLDYLLQV